MEKHDGCKDVYENCKHYRSSKYRRDFLIVTSIFTIAVIVAIVCMHCDFKQSQQKIIDIHKEHLDKTQECLTSIYNNLKNEPVNCDSLIHILECDKTLAKKIVNYPAVKNLILGIANNMSYRAMADELKKDSILINRQLANAQHATNELLELHFNRIQHEYTVLALWAGVLMIVFLIFSFYSLYKTDDISQQSKESLKEIKEKGDNVLNDLKVRQDELQKSALKTLIKINRRAGDFENEITTISDEVKGKINKLGAMAESLKQRFEIMGQWQTPGNESNQNEKEDDKQQQ